MSSPTLDAAVFVFVREVPELGARVGDRLLVRPDAPRPLLLQRELRADAAAWCRSQATAFLWSRPNMPEGLVQRITREANLDLGGAPPGTRGGPLTLLR